MKKAVMLVFFCTAAVVPFCVLSLAQEEELPPLSKKIDIPAASPTPLGDILDYMRKELGINLTASPEFEKKEIKLMLVQVPWKKALEELAERAGGQVVKVAKNWFNIEPLTVKEKDTETIIARLEKTAQEIKKEKSPGEDKKKLLTAVEKVLTGQKETKEKLRELRKKLLDLNREGLDLLRQKEEIRAKNPEVRKELNENSAISSMVTIRSAQEVSKAKYKTYSSLQDLYKKGLIDKKLASGKNDGYEFTVKVDGAKSWSAAARPVEPGKTGGISLYISSGTYYLKHKPCTKKSDATADKSSRSYGR